MNQHVLTFLNRASKVNLEPISIAEIELFFRKSFNKLGLKLNDKLISEAAARTEGSPYLMQLVGHYITVSAADDGVITDIDFDKAITLARREFIKDICETTIAPLSAKDIEFLKAMAIDDSESAMKDIALRLSVDSSYANRYRTRLMQSDVIKSTRRGYVEFAVPYLRDYFAAEDK